MFFMTNFSISRQQSTQGKYCKCLKFVFCNWTHFPLKGWREWIKGSSTPWRPCRPTLGEEGSGKSRHCTFWRRKLLICVLLRPALVVVLEDQYVSTDVRRSMHQLIQVTRSYRDCFFVFIRMFSAPIFLPFLPLTLIHLFYNGFSSHKIVCT